MFSISHFLMRVKRKILRDSSRILNNAFHDYMHRDAIKKGDILLNIGAGHWYCKGWTNLDYPSEWYAKAQSHHEFIIKPQEDSRFFKREMNCAIKI